VYPASAAVIDPPSLICTMEFSGDSVPKLRAGGGTTGCSAATAASRLANRKAYPASMPANRAATAASSELWLYLMFANS
jgi:hypothetical protein